IIKDYTSRVPGSFYEEKDFAITWHYRNSPAEFASYQARKLHDELETGLANLPVTVSSGKKIVEVKAVEANKGVFLRWLLQTYPHLNRRTLFILGDDATDEDMFANAPSWAFTVKVGNK